MAVTNRGDGTWRNDDGHVFTSEHAAKSVYSSGDAFNDMTDPAFQAAEAGLKIGGAIAMANIGKAGKLYGEGLDLYEAGDMDGAEKIFDQAAKKSLMSCGTALAMKGYIHYKQGDKDKALAAWKKVINSRAYHKANAHAFRSELYASMGDTEKATTDCCEAVNGSYRMAYNATEESLSDFLSIRGEDISGFEQRCFPLLRAAAEKGDKRAYAGLAECYDQGYGVQKDEQEAMKWFEKAAAAGYLNGMIKIGKPKIAIFFRALLYNKISIVGGILGAVILSIPTMFIGAIPGAFLGSRYIRVLLKKLLPGYSGLDKMPQKY